MDTILDKIKQLAKEKKLSLNQIEEQAGLGKNSLYGWGKSQPKIDSVSKVADILDTNADFLLGRSNDPSPINEEDDPAVFFRIDMKNVPEDKRDEFKRQLTLLKEVAFQQLREEEEKIKREKDQNS